MRAVVATFLVLAVLLGCASRQRPTEMPTLTQPMEPEPEPADNPGSLFSSPQAEYLFDDNRAKRVGDIVLVVVSETTNAKNKAETDLSRDGSNDFSVTNMSDDTPFRMLTKPIFGDVKDAIKTNTKTDHKGSGETKREATFTATVATRIVRMLPGRVMQVEGARQIRVNDETQILVVRGLLRERDVQSDNSVPSSKLAQAQIEVYGEGIVDDKQRPGWLTRILDNIWPF